MHTIADWAHLPTLDHQDRRAHGETVRSLPMTQFELFYYQMQANRLRSLSGLKPLPFISINPPANGKLVDPWGDFTDSPSGYYIFDMQAWCEICNADYNPRLYAWGSARWSDKHAYYMQHNRILRARGLKEIPIVYPDFRRDDDIFA